ncbi:DUF2637 domain-containing protein [Streptomyces sp. NBC_01768]|uniref:DUF2637 domain-containing protein n=1 Tax=Streptomyces sp. NBC_01768 TaxID=2975938 RepID=UPI002DD7A004|nr:DUF2637 domain-containing protein [Streptomyces sp. NBC_01768]WSC31835.1 DUF2637 domain-containing protein [Streptomyces sp. NBC_01768]
MRATLARIDPILIQAVIAAGLSFSHIHDIAEAAGQGGWKAWAYPVSVDLLLVAAWQKLRVTKRSLLGWSWFLVALTASLGANVATAGLLDMTALPVWLKVLVGGWPAVAFLGGTLLVHGRKVEADPEATSDEVDDQSEGDTAPFDELTLDIVDLDPVPLPEPRQVEQPKAHITDVKTVAEALAVSPATVRGWANGDRPKVTHHGYDDKGRTLVDLIECRARVVMAK